MFNNIKNIDEFVALWDREVKPNLHYRDIKTIANRINSLEQVTLKPASLRVLLSKCKSGKQTNSMEVLQKLQLILDASFALLTERENKFNRQRLELQSRA